MAEMTVEQQKVLALAAARLRLKQTQQAQPAQEDGSMSADNAARSFATGVPIIGGALNKMDAAFNATLAPIVDPMLPDSFQKLSGETWGDRYQQALGIQEGKDAAFSKEHPYADTALQVAGGVAGTIPAIMAAPGAFGAGGGSLVTNSLISGASGAAIGAADGAVRSDGDPAAAWNGAKWGAALGAAGPATAKVVGAGVKSLISAGRNAMAARAAGVNAQSLSKLGQAVARDGLDPAAVQQRLADLGPDAMMADLGPNLQKQTGALAASPGRGQEIVRTALADRQAGANARLASVVDETTGRNVVPSDIASGIDANEAALSPAYRQAMSGAQPYDVTPIADAIDQSIGQLRGNAQTALRRVRGMLNVVNTNRLSSDPNVMFQTRQAIDGMLKTEVDPKVISALTETRQMIDDGLTRAVPQIKEADAGYAELERQRAALSRGQQVLDSGRTAPRPSELAVEVQQGAEPQGMQIGPSAVPLRMSQGARAEIDRIVGTNANDIQAMNRLIKGEGDWNRSRLATLFGQEKADRLFKVLENEKLFADTANTVTRNSETAARQAAQADLGVIETGGFGAKEAFKAGGIRGAARSYALDKADQVLSALMQNRGEAVRGDLAKMLVTKNRDDVIRALAAGSGAREPALVNPVVRALLLSSGTARAR